MGRWWSELGSVNMFLLLILYISDIISKYKVKIVKFFPKLVSTLTQEPAELVKKLTVSLFINLKNQSPKRKNCHWLAKNTKET